LLFEKEAALTPLSRRFDQALAYASDLHRDQHRKGTEIPYVSHLLIVAGTALEHGADEETAIAALLHDAIEDQGGNSTRQEIIHRFGQSVADLVDEVSDAEVMPKPPWRERKEIYLARLTTMSPGALLIAVADKVHNARATLADHSRHGDAVWGRFNEGKDGQRWFYETFLAQASRHPAAPHALLDELRRIEHELFE
jgi:(p)ppGpp synthase/HD superfamily hydrolase